MASTAVGTHTGGAGPLSLMSCVRESSPQESIPDLDNDKNVASKKKFWNPRKWFKRKSNKVTEDSTPSPENPEPAVKEALRSRSTSEISETDEPLRRRSGTPMHPGLSVSHDSIFHSPNSGSELELGEAQSTSSLSIQHNPTQTELRLQTELSERLRLRRGRGDTSEDDEGLPRSPCCNSPTATEGLLEKTAIKNHPTKSHSTCSDGSLLSMGSSEIEEDSFGQQSSRYSSKLSLYDKKPGDQDSEWELGPSSAAAPLNHSAAHHRVAVRPKRTHGAPRRKRIQPVAGSALPTTPEVNEDSSLRSSTPDTAAKETVTELYSSTVSMSKTRTESQLKCSSLPPGLVGPGTENSKLNRSRSSAGSKSQDTFAALGEEDEDKDDKKSDHSIFARLFPRRSGKKKKSKQETVTTSSMLSYSKQTGESSSSEYSSKLTDKRPYSVDSKLTAPRSGPASRQRVQPIDIPATPDAVHRELETSLPKASPDKPPPSTSPLQLELENHFRQRMVSSLSASPPKFSLPAIETPPQSPKSPRIFASHSPSSPPRSLWAENMQFTKASTTRYFESNRESKIEDYKGKVVSAEDTKSKIVVSETSKNKVVVADDSKSRVRLSEESKSKVKIAGLSSLQQRVLSHDEDSENTFKSLTDFSSSDNANSRIVTKSHSFKSKSNENSVKNDYSCAPSIMSKSDSMENKSLTVECKPENSIFKAASLDSVKNVQVPNHFEKDGDIFKSDSSESLESDCSTKTSSTEYLDSLNPCNNSITISGPSHTSVVSVCTSRDAQIVDSIIKTQPVMFTLEKEPDISQQPLSKEMYIKEEQTFKEQQFSVTKIQVKRESMQVSQNMIRNTIPEFFNIHLNKVDAKPATNVVLTANLCSPKLENEGENKPKTVFNFDTPKEPEKTEKPPETPTRKFSQDDIEVIDKDSNEEIVEIPSKNVSTPATPNVIITSMIPPASARMYKKHSEVISQYSRKSSLVTTDSKAKISLRTKSNSLDIVDSLKQNSDPLQTNLDKSDASKQKVSSTTDLQESVSTESVVLRRKSLVKQKQDEEPELMKVFARRSLKLKDSDDMAQQVLVMVEDAKNAENSDTVMSKSRDSDKENQLDSPPEERKKSLTKEVEKPKEPLVETKFVETTEVTLRKPINNKLFAYQQRTVSLSIPKANEINAMDKVQKNNSFSDRPKTEISEKVTNKTWITTVKKDSESKEEVVKISRDDVITDLSSKSDFINEDFPTIPKNFNQRKAEWEKRAQEALKKSVP